MNILTNFYGNNVCKICKHYVLDMALSISQSVGNIGFNLHFHMVFFSGSESKF